MKLCKRDCSKFARVFGLCRAHYAALRRKKLVNLIASRKASRKWLNKNREKKAARQRKLHRESRLRALAYYGKDKKVLCNWKDCAVSDPDMLTLDHVANDGAIKRKQGEPRGLALYTNKKGFAPGLQTLCANHQMKKEALRRKKLKGE